MTEDVIASCREIEAEILRVLTEKFSWEFTRAQSALKAVLLRSIHIELHGTVKDVVILTTICFSSALRAQRQILLVAGDKDLLILGSYKETRIVTPAKYAGDWP